MKRVYSSKVISDAEIYQTKIPEALAGLMRSTATIEAKAAAMRDHPMKFRQIEDRERHETIFRVRSFALEASDIPILIDALPLLYWKCIERFTDSGDQAQRERADVVDRMYRELLMFRDWEGELNAD